MVGPARRSRSAPGAGVGQTGLLVCPHPRPWGTLQAADRDHHGPPPAARTARHRQKEAGRTKRGCDRQQTAPDVELGKNRHAARWHGAVTRQDRRNDVPEDGSPCAAVGSSASVDAGPQTRAGAAHHRVAERRPGRDSAAVVVVKTKLPPEPPRCPRDFNFPPLLAKGRLVRRSVSPRTHGRG